MISWLKKFKRKKKECYFCHEMIPSSKIFALHVKSADGIFILDTCESCVASLESVRHGVVNDAIKLVSDASRGQLDE